MNPMAIVRFLNLILQFLSWKCTFYPFVVNSPTDIKLYLISGTYNTFEILKFIGFPCSSSVSIIHNYTSGVIVPFGNSNSISLSNRVIDVNLLLSLQTCLFLPESMIQVVGAFSLTSHRLNNNAL